MPVRDSDLFLSRLWALDRALVAAGWPETSPWWRRQIDRFFRSGCRRWVLRVGRRGGKSSTLCRVAVAWALFGEWDVPPGDTAVIPFVSIDRSEAGGRLRTILEILDVLGVSRQERGETITIRVHGRPLMFRVATCSVSGTVGFTSVATFADEMARWESRETSANPAKEVMGSLRPTMATQAAAFEACSSSPWGEDDYHHELFEAGDSDDQCVAHAATWEANPTITEDETHRLEPDQKTWSREYAAIPSQGVVNNWFGLAVDVALSLGVEPSGIRNGMRPLFAIDPAWVKDYFGWAVSSSEPAEAAGATAGPTKEVWLQNSGAYKPEPEKPLDPEETLTRFRDEIVLPTLALAGRSDETPVVHTDQAEFYSLKAIARRLGIRLELIAWTAGTGENSKLTRHRAVRTGMRAREVRIPDKPSLVRQFRAVSGVLLPSGNERIVYGNVEGHSDELAASIMSLSVALESVPAAAVVRVGPVRDDVGAQMRAARMKEVERRQKQQWDRDPRNAIRSAMRR